MSDVVSRKDSLCSSLAREADARHVAIFGGKRGEACSTVYVIHCATTNLVKIGWSHQPGGRLREIQASCPTTLSLVTLLQGSIHFEQFLHGYYATYRQHGEWFRLPSDVLRELPTEVEQLRLDFLASQPGVSN